MERVDHVHIVKVCGGSLICHVYRVLQRQVPDGEGLKLRIARLDAALVVMVELRKAGCHLSASRSRSRYHDKFSLCLDIVILSVALVAYDERDVRGISGYGIMVIDLDPEALQLFSVRHCAWLLRKSCHYDRSDVEPAIPECVDKAENIHIIGDAEVSSHFVLFDVRRVDRYDDLGVLLELHQHVDLTVGPESRKNTGSVIIVKQFSSELQIELSSEKVYPLKDVLRLHFYIFVIVKTYAFHDLVLLLRITQP